MFKEIDSLPNFSAVEKEILSYWESLIPVERLKELRKNSPEYVYYDGPITANGRPHYGHCITWTMKDVVPRYWTMKNYYVSRNMGWDCQGILVEVEVEKELGFKHKDDIVKFGIDKFNDACKSSVLKLKDLIFDYEKKMGRWIDEKDEYYTMDPKYIESMWWSIKELYNKGLLYEDFKNVAYSTRAGTTLSSHEVKDGGYKDIEDDYVIIKFKLKDEDSYLLCYTTTPWTLFGNLLIGVKKDSTYAKVSSQGQSYICAKDLVETIFKDDYQIIEEFDSSKIEGKEYLPVFSHYENKRSEGAFKVIFANHAVTSEGTGLVHLAPYGEEDFEILREKKIKAFDYLDDTANFTNEIPEFQGMFYKEANSRIIEDLISKGLMFNHGKVIHRMPMCYRTNTPLIYKPIKSWYLNVEKLKPRLLEENEKIRWVPEHVKKGNSGTWIENAKDWCLSRNRYWGTPMPIWKNDLTNEFIVIGSFDELKELSGKEISDPHRPYVDDISWEDKLNGGVYRRVVDVIDVWYDSGSVPFAKVYYPKNTELFNEKFPAKYISEGMDQTHLWFYTMLVLNVALFDKAPFENCIVTGMLLDKNSKKLSKSKGNYPPIDEVLDNYSADILRYFALTSPVVQGEFTRFYEDLLKEIKKEFFLIYWNTLKFFVTYANMNNFDPSNKIQSEDTLDRWIKLRVKESKTIIINSMDNYEIMPAAREFAPLINDLSTWYVRRSREKIKNGDISSLSTLYDVLCEITLLIAPFFPFLAEKSYQVLALDKTRNLESVHFDLLTGLEETLSEDDKEMLLKMTSDRKIITELLNLRTVAKVSLRQPLLNFHSKKEVNFPELVLDEANIKSISNEDFTHENVVSNQEKTITLNLEITEELKNEGILRDFLRKVQDLRKSSNLKVEDKIILMFSENDIPENVINSNLDVLEKKINATKIVKGIETKIELVS